MTNGVEETLKFHLGRLQNYIELKSYKLENGSAKIVLESSAAPLSWDSWSVRDIAMLTNPDASFVNEDSKITMYYTGCSNQMELQQTGRAYSYDCGKSWEKDPNNPILHVSPGAWDSKVSSSPWVLKIGNDYMMYYRGSSQACKQDAIGLATSADGVSFHKHSNNPIIRPSQFNGILKNPTALGVLNAIHSHEGNVMVFFEALESGYDQKCQIFGAQSDDGINFSPLNQGNPIFSARNVTSWPVRGVCNPRVIPLREKGYLLGFNGTYDGEHSIGFAYTENLKDWEEMKTNPIIVPRGFPEEDTSSYRIEGPVLNSMDLKVDKELIDCFFMSIPGAVNNQKNSVINLAKLRIDQSKENKLRFITNPSDKNSIKEEEDTISIDASKERSGFLQGSIVKNNSIKELKIEITFLTCDKESEFNIQISNSLNPFPKSYGFIMKITPKQILLKRNTAYKALPDVPLNSLWQIVKIFETTPDSFRISLCFQENVLLSINGETFRYPKEAIRSYDSRVVTFSCIKSSVELKEICLS